jgi:hypothetical protein
VELFDLEPGRPTHVALTYSPGRLVAYRDGEPVLESDAITGSFTFHWKLRALRFGAEAGGGGDWHGLLEGVALHARELAPEAVRESAERYRALREARPAVPRWRVRARLRSKSVVPTLDQISPYRRALAIYEYRLLGEPERIAGPGAAAGEAPSGTVRVARWVLLDGAVQPEADLAPGSEEVLELEPYAANPQLGDVYLSDTLGAEGEGAGGRLYYGVAGSAARSVDTATSSDLRRDAGSPSPVAVCRRGSSPCALPANPPAKAYPSAAPAVPDRPRMTVVVRRGHGAVAGDGPLQERLVLVAQDPRRQDDLELPVEGQERP